MPDEIQSKLIEKLAAMGEGMKGVVQRIERLEQWRLDAFIEEEVKEDVTFDDQIDYLEELLKDRHLELVRRRRAYIESIGEMHRTEAYLEELLKTAKAITASIPSHPEDPDKVLSEQP